MSAQLRVYRAADDEFFDDKPEPEVHVRLGDLLPLVALAKRCNFIWLQDFLDDNVCITRDLHEVLMTFRDVRPSA